ncbi:MAG: serine protease [Flavobacteriaceae bacterium]
MIKKLIILQFLCMFMCSTSCMAQIDSVLVSKVTFKDTNFNNLHAGSGFVLEYQNKLYAVTAKHVLFFAKTDHMKTISFGDALQSWEFMSKTNPVKKVIAGRLINENPNERLEMPPKGDWLIFELKEDIPEGIAVFSVREQALKPNEPLFFMGYPYKSDAPIKVSGQFLGFTEDHNLRLDVPKGTYNGCSGGPVFDAEGKLVGLVSMGYFNAKDNIMVFEPASLDYFKQIINN